MKSAKSGKIRDISPIISETSMVSPDYYKLNFLKYWSKIKTGPGDIAGDIEVARNLHVKKYIIDANTQISAYSMSVICED